MALRKPRVFQALTMWAMEPRKNDHPLVLGYPEPRTEYSSPQ